MTALSLGALAAAKPVTLTRRAGTDLASQIIGNLAPQSLSCAGATKPDECRTNVQVAPQFIAAFQKYDIYTYPEMAAVLALCALESGSFKFKENLVHAGQGTVNQQGFEFNKKYAADLGGSAAQCFDAAGSDQKKAVACLYDDSTNFASGAWFYDTQCQPSVRAAFKTGAEAGWTAYMQCVGVPADNPERVAFWTAAKKAFGIA
jgi:hypothetical protein